MVRLIAFLLQPLLALCLIGGHPSNAQARPAEQQRAQIVDDACKGFLRDRIGATIRTSAAPESGAGIDGDGPKQLVQQLIVVPSPLASSDTRQALPGFEKNIERHWPRASLSTAPPVSVAL